MRKLVFMALSLANSIFCPAWGVDKLPRVAVSEEITNMFEFSKADLGSFNTTKYSEFVMVRNG
jgi:hypothetical protein